MDKTRITWIDTFKGISILLVVVGHLQSPYVVYIYLIHMALFFLISGYTYRSSEEKILSYTMRKAVGLVIPFYLLNIVFIFLTILLNETILTQAVGADKISLEGYFSVLFSEDMNTAELGGPSWFLPVLFEGEVLCHVIVHLLGKVKALDKVKEFALLIPGGIGYYCEMTKNWLPFRFDLGLCACLLLGIGMLIKKYKVLEEVPKGYGALISAVTLLFFGGAYFRGKMPVNWASREFPKIWVFLICSLAGFFLIYLLADLLGELKIQGGFQYLGRNTFPILMYHFLFFRLLSVVLYYAGVVEMEDVLQSPLIRSTSVLWMGYTVFAIACCMGLSYLTKKTRVLNYLVNGRWKRKEKGGEKHGTK